MTRVPIAVVNWHRGNPAPLRTAATVLAYRPHIILGNEAQRPRNLPGLRRLGPPAGAGAYVNDCAIWVRRHITVHDTWTQQLTDPVPDRPVQHDRWCRVALTETDGLRLGLIAVHLNAAIQDRDGSVPRSRGARQNAAAMRSLTRLTRWMQHDGYAVVIGGDFNYRARNIGPEWRPEWRYSPSTVLPLRTWSSGVDWLAVDADLSLHDFRTATAPRLDHPVLLGTLVR